MQQDTNLNHPVRRVTDLAPTGLAPTIQDVWKLLVDINEGLAEVKRQQKDFAAAFIKNEFDEPDLDGHRKSHTKLQKSEEIIQEYKTDATKQILTIVITFIVGLIASGFMAKLGEFIK